VGIVGCGYVGKDLAILLRAMGCEVLANDIKDFSEFYTLHGIKSVGLDELIQKSNVVTLHVPHNETTHNLMSAERLAMMRQEVRTPEQ
jgi:D-3-phosphoglycerate dehydrogenase